MSKIKIGLEMKETLLISPNGVKIYGYRNEVLHGFCICLYIKAGPLYEEAHENGISHFWEHMAFRNINTALGGELHRRVDSLGASIDAVTFREFIQLKISGATEKFRECAEILTSVFTPFCVPTAEIDIERRRIKSEIRESDEQTSLDSFTRKIVWNGTSLANPIIGKRGILDKIGAKALFAAQEKFLSADNIFFYITGAYRDGDIEYFSSLIGKYKLSSECTSRQNIAPIPNGFGNRNAYIDVKNDSCHFVRFNFDAICGKYTRAEHYLLYDILFAGECSLLFKALSEETGLVYSFDACFEKYANIGNLYFSFEVASGKVYEAVERTVAVLNSLCEKPYEGLDCTRSAYVINTGLLLDDCDELNWDLGYEYHVMGIPFSGLDKRRADFESVTKADLQRMASEIFKRDNLVLTVKDTKARIDTEKLSTILSGLGR